MKPRAYTNGTVMTTQGPMTDVAVVVDNGRIVDIVDAQGVASTDFEIEDLGGYLLLPGFIDTQVNGGGGVLFNDDPSVGSIAAIAAAHRRIGTTGILPTLISDDLDVVDRALRAAEDAIDAGVAGVLGVHIEGPFLNAVRRGIHDERKLKRLTVHKHTCSIQQM